MKIWRFENFIVLVKAGSINAAAEQLHISPQALHQQMDTLESEVGCKLLVRSRKGIQLTAAGTVFHKQIGTLIKDYRSLIQQTLDEDARERNTIYTSSGALFRDHIFVNALIQFKKHYPNIIVKKRSLSDLEINACDVLASDVVYAPDRYSGYNSVRSNCFIHVQRSHRLASKKQIRLEDLFGEVLLVNSPDLLNRLNFPFWQKIRENVSKLTIDVLPFLDASSADTTVISTNHVYLCWGIQPSLHPELRQIPIENSEFEYTMLYHKERYKESKGLQIYLEFMAQYYKKHWQSEYDRILGQ